MNFFIPDDDVEDNVFVVLLVLLQSDQEDPMISVSGSLDYLCFQVHPKT